MKETMNNTVCISAFRLSRYALEPLFEGDSPLERVLSFAQTLPGCTEIIVYADSENKETIQRNCEKHPARTRLVEAAGESADDFLKMLEDQAGSSANIFLLSGDEPLLDPEITARMYADHSAYLADYSFADGYPLGLSPQIIRSTAIGSCRALVRPEEDKLERNSLFEIIRRDINSFEIETEISPVDMRLLRAELVADSKRNLRLLESVYQAGGRDAETIIQVLREKPEILRTFPRYISIQIAGGCPQACSYCPYPAIQPDLLKNRDYLKRESFKDILEQVARLCDDAVIGLSLWGEPGMHPEIAAFAADVADYSGFSLFIETSGVGWNEGVFEEIRNNGPEDINWVVSLDTDDPGLYRELRGEGYDAARESAAILEKLFPGRVYVQAVRMLENEEHLETMFRTWKERPENFIVQKYDHFSGKLPERKVADLSPVKRFPCRHLQRDLYVRMDGTVPLCREDIESEYVLGNILKENIETIWERGEEYYRRHIQNDYPEICKGCDEYYTFNF
ncbi:MAG: spiro-SPASM protein [Spirochaetales bacterium]|nr:spiro-SPASM protein [Spirochaetales bacterium]